MLINKLHPILRKFRAPEPGDDGGGSANEDRGDDFVPTDDDADTAKAALEVKDKPKDPPKAEKAAKADAADADGEEDEDADKDDKGGKKDTRMPLSRHKAVLEKERQRADELERQLARYQGGDRVAATNEAIKATETQIEALDKEYAKLITDGNHEKAAETRRQMRALENQIIEQKSDMKAAAASAQAVEKMRYDTTVDRLEAAYPALNPDHEEHDAEAAQDVLDLATAYRTRRGMTPAQAIQAAAVKLLGAETKKQEAATSVKVRVDPEEAVKAAEKEALDKAAERKRAQVNKNLEAAGKQPADTSKVGADSDKAGGGISAKDVLKMSQADFNKLDEATLARMRGDVIA